uniref:Uncharacterized protein n=1 Tax=Opuntia streptacantha TaxID=393608 RepID=A0A7C9D6L6_OPUST
MLLGLWGGGGCLTFDWKCEIQKRENLQYNFSKASSSSSIERKAEETCLCKRWRRCIRNDKKCGENEQLTAQKEAEVQEVFSSENISNQCLAWVIRGMQKEWISRLNVYSAIASNCHSKGSHKEEEARVNKLVHDQRRTGKNKAESRSKKKMKLPDL